LIVFFQYRLPHTFAYSRFRSASEAKRRTLVDHATLLEAIVIPA